MIRPVKHLPQHLQCCTLLFAVLSIRMLLYTLKCMQPLACLFVCWQNRARAFITVRMAKPAASRKTAAGMARSGDIMCTLANTLMTLVACQPTPHLVLVSHAQPAHVL